jgi:hypothetical protein
LAQSKAVIGFVARRPQHHIENQSPIFAPSTKQKEERTVALPPTVIDSAIKKCLDSGKSINIVYFLPLLEMHVRLYQVIEWHSIVVPSITEADDPRLKVETPIT